MKNQTKNICLEALKIDGRSYRFIKDGVLNKNSHKKMSTVEGYVYANKLNGEWKISTEKLCNITKREFLNELNKKVYWSFGNKCKAQCIDFLNQLDKI